MLANGAALKVRFEIAPVVGTGGTGIIPRGGRFFLRRSGTDAPDRARKYSYRDGELGKAGGQLVLLDGNGE
jgi:hypothetical protein